MLQRRFECWLSMTLLPGAASHGVILGAAGGHCAELHGGTDYGRAQQNMDYRVAFNSSTQGWRVCLKDICAMSARP